MSATSATGEGSPGPPTLGIGGAPPAGAQSSGPVGDTFSGESLIGGISSERCSVCDAELAPDQRYCVECGTRRGRPRFSLPTAAAAGAEVDLARGTEGASMSSTRQWLLAGIVALLLAIAVGILIGQSIAPTVHVSVGSTPAAAAGTGSSTGTGSGTTPGTSSTGGSAKQPTGSGTTTTGSGGIGSSCKAGAAGCVNGHQTGNVFGS